MPHPATLILLLLFAFCARAADLPTITLAIPGPNVAPFLPVELISRLGADQRAGFRLVLRHFGGGPLAARDMLEKNSEFAGLGMPALAGIRLDNPEPVSIAALTLTPAYVLMVRKDLNRVRRVADLSGRSIGVHVGGKLGKSTARQMAEYLLAKDKVHPDQVNFVHSGQNLADYAAALRSGQADAIVVNEPAATLLERQGLARRLTDLHDADAARRYLGGRFLYTQIASTRTLLKGQPEKARMLAAALRESLAWIARQKAEAIVQRMEMPESEEKLALIGFLSRHKDIYSPTGAFDPGALANSEAFFRFVNPEDARAAALRFSDMTDARWIAPAGK